MAGPRGWQIWHVLLVQLWLGAHGAPYGSRPVARAQDPGVLSYRVVAEYAHDPLSFTQGLEFDRVCNEDGKECNEIFWESTGLYGQSSVREVLVATGEVRKRTAMDSKWFGEGLARWGDELLQIVWRSGKGFKYAVDGLAKTGEFMTPLKDGWGLTQDGKSLIATDSSAVLYFLDPVTLELQRQVTVTDGGREVPWLNELEVIEGELWANVWQTECIARVNMTTGRVSTWMVMQGLRAAVMQNEIKAGRSQVAAKMDVLNGIAYDDINKRIFVTGKLWPKVIHIMPKPAGPNQNLARARELCWPKVSGMG